MPTIFFTFLGQSINMIKIF
uniref:Uncharacterized protein n=1 Tax=Arundo donax TaxID=35708 RepID=A0A0A9F8T4_ARUDO